MERVVGNYHVCAYKEKQASKKESATTEAGASPPAQRRVRAPPNAYETEEHLAVGLPGFGMRISVSKQDLTEINELTNAAGVGSKHVRRASAPEAYPVPSLPAAVQGK